MLGWLSRIGWWNAVEPGAVISAYQDAKRAKVPAAGEDLSHFLPVDVIDYESYGAIRDLVVFDGPPVRAIGSVPYVTLTQYGIKAEGDCIYPDPETRCWTEAEALFRFRRTLFDYLRANPARQLAWRQRPFTQQGPNGDYVVRCRLALLSEPLRVREMA